MAPSRNRQEMTEMKIHRIVAMALAVLTLSLGAWAQDSSRMMGEGGQVHLKAKIHRKWKIRLPAPATKEVGTLLAFKDGLGVDFKAAVDGEALKLDADGDGVLETSVEGEGGFVVLRHENHRYGLRLAAAPRWSFTPGTTMNGEIDGVKVQLVDQNLNGRFDDIGEDAIVVGRGKAAAFLSRVIDLGQGHLVNITVSPDGATLDYSPYTGPRGRLALKLDTKGKVLTAVLKSVDGDVSVAFSRPEVSLNLPAGEYRFHSAVLSLGGNRVTARTGRSRTITVKAGGESTFELGGPVKAEFAYVRQGDTLNFSPDNIWFYGRAGEEYYDWAPCGMSPKISVVSKSGREIAEAYFPGSS